MPPFRLSPDINGMLLHATAARLTRYSENKFPRIPCVFSTFVRDARKWRWVPFAPPLAKLIHATVVALMAEVRRRKSPLKAALQLFFSRVLPPLCKVHCCLGTHHSTGTVRDGLTCRLACLPYATLLGNSTPLKSTVRLVLHLWFNIYIKK